MAIAETNPIAVYTNNADASSYTNTLYVPTANTALTAFVTLTGYTGTPTLTGGSGWSTSPTLVTSATYNSGVSTLYLFSAVAGASPGNFTPVVGATGGATGCCMWFQEWSGTDLTTPILQYKIKNSTTGSNPTITFDASVQSTSGVSMAYAMAANPPNVTADAQLTRETNTGHTSPTNGLGVDQADNGCSGATFTGTRASINHGIIIVEMQVPIVFTNTGGTLTMMGV